MTVAEQRIARLIGRAPRRIAVVRALHLGDLLLTVPAFRALRRGFPNAEITLIGLPWAASFVERFAMYLDRFEPFPGYPGINEVEFDPARTDAFLRDQCAYGYDLVVQLHGSGRTSNPFALALGGTLTAGFYDGSRQNGLGVITPRSLSSGRQEGCGTAEGKIDLDIAIRYPDDLHEIERNLRLAAILGCTADDASLEFPLTDADRSEADALLAGVGPLIGIHPGAKHPSRRWPADRFAAVADDLSSRYDARVVITGGPDETVVANDVAGRMRTPATVLAGETSIGGLAALIERLDLFVLNDTGPAHIAGALGTPTVVVFGPADLRRWEPRGERSRVIVRDVVCRPCGQAVCPIDHPCLLRIGPDEVITAACALFGVPYVPQGRVYEQAMSGTQKGSACVV